MNESVEDEPCMQPCSLLAMEGTIGGRRGGALELRTQEQSSEQAWEPSGAASALPPIC